MECVSRLYFIIILHMVGLEKGQKITKGVLIDSDVFKEDVESIMVSRGLSKKQLCKLIGINSRTLDNALYGQRVLPSTCKKLHAYGLTVRTKKADKATSTAL